MTHKPITSITLEDEQLLMGMCEKLNLFYTCSCTVATYSLVLYVGIGLKYVCIRPYCLHYLETSFTAACMRPLTLN